MTLRANRDCGCTFVKHYETVKRRHDLVHGTPDAPHQCHECDSEFWSIEEWQRHHQSNHFSTDFLGDGPEAAVEKMPKAEILFGGDE